MVQTYVLLPSFPPLVYPPPSDTSLHSRGENGVLPPIPSYLIISMDEQPASPPGSEPSRMDRLMMQLRMIFAMKYAQSDPMPVQLLEIGPMFPTEFTYLNISLLDSMEANLLAVLPGALSFIETARQSGGKTLVHCFAGKSRSSSVCIAYLMQTERLNLLEALRYVRRKREVVMPNTGFMHQLKTFERSLGIAPGVET